MFNVIKSQPMIRERVVFRDGRRKLVVRLNLYVDDLIESYDRAQAKLEYAEKMFKKDASELHAREYGEAAVALVQAVFGAEPAAAIFTFYNGRHIQMLADVYPFIQKKILPKLRNPFTRLRLGR